MCKLKFWLALERESGVKVTAIYVAWNKKQTVPDTTRTRTYMKTQKKGS